MCVGVHIIDCVLRQVHEPSTLDNFTLYKQTICSSLFKVIKKEKNKKQKTKQNKVKQKQTNAGYSRKSVRIILRPLPHVSGYF